MNKTCNHCGILFQDISETQVMEICEDCEFDMEADFLKEFDDEWDEDEY